MLFEVAKQGSPSSIEKESSHKLNDALTVLYIWILILLYLKGRLKNCSKSEFAAIFLATLKTLTSLSNQVSFSNYVQTMIYMISDPQGNLAFTENSPFVGSLVLNDQTKKSKSLNECNNNI